jgi:hypothetical protein
MMLRLAIKEGDIDKVTKILGTKNDLVEKVIKEE